MYIPDDRQDMIDAMDHAQTFAQCLMLENLTLAERADILTKNLSVAHI